MNYKQYLGHNDILGENPCNTVTPGKSRCVVKGMFLSKGTNVFLFLSIIFFSFLKGLTYCTLNKIERDALLTCIYNLYPDFAEVIYAEKFRVTFDLRQVGKKMKFFFLIKVLFLNDVIFQCELNESKSFYKLDADIQMLIRERNPKLQTEGRTNVINQHSHLRSYGNTRMSIESNLRRPMNTIVELSAEQTQTSIEDLDFSRDEIKTSLSPLAQGKFVLQL